MTLITSQAKNLPDIDVPTVEEIEQARASLNDLILTTPVWQTHSNAMKQMMGDKTEVFFKFEIWQFGGTFKPRGALINMMRLTEPERKKGVTAASAGNHAIAVSYAANVFNVSAKVVMPKTASPKRIEQCQNYGAEVVLADDMFAVFERVKHIMSEEGRAFIHPFEGKNVALGTATLGLEVCQQIPNLDAVLFAIGGGGLAGGAGAAIKQWQPNCKIYGVEPEGAATLARSFQAGKPIKLDRIDTIADSLSPPSAEPYSFNLCSRFVDGIVTVDDVEIIDAMRYLFQQLKLAVEPACATALAGMFGTLKPYCQNKRVAIILCGSNTDAQSFARYLNPSATQLNT